MNIEFYISKDSAPGIPSGEFAKFREWAQAILEEEFPNHYVNAIIANSHIVADTDDFANEVEVLTFCSKLPGIYGGK